MMQTNQEIIDSCTNGVSECNCEKCQSMCRTPCLGTPQDMADLIDAGYLDRLASTLWAVGVINGTHDKMVKMIQPKLDQDKGYCTFYQNGLCELHDLGLKPLEGKLASCKQEPIKSLQELAETPLYKVVKLWENFQ